MIKITIYSKPKCHLCDEMKLTLEKLKKNFDFELKIINIESDLKLYAKFSEKIPVLYINGKIFAKYKIDESKFLKKLNSESKTH